LSTLAETVLGAADATGAGHFGPNPATNPNFTHLATGAATVPDGHGGTLNLGDAHGHSDYPRFPDGGGTRTTNYNIAAVLAGLGDQAVSTDAAKALATLKSLPSFEHTQTQVQAAMNQITLPQAN
jgi:hypothetical protein